MSVLETSDRDEVPATPSDDVKKGATPETADLEICRIHSARRTASGRRTSSFFTTPSARPGKTKQPRPPAGTVSSLPFPPLSSPRFGVIQEELAQDPFRLLIAVTLLIRTRGTAAIPTFYRLTERYPTPDSLAEADAAEITALIGHLGFGVTRAATVQKYGRIWVENPPRAGVRYVVRNYPAAAAGDGAAMTTAWEVGHMTQGPYAIDSWRIFCRDVLLGRAADWNGGGAGPPGFQPEWMRVRPRDKELRAYLRWMWLREGFVWDAETGERAVLSPELSAAVNAGRVEWDGAGRLVVAPAGGGEGGAGGRGMRACT